MTEALLDAIQFNADGLVAAIAQQHDTGEILMFAWMNREAFAETLALEVAGFGIDVTIAEPGPVSSGALDDVLAYRLPGDPYADVLAGSGVRSDLMISPEQVAAALADLVERPAVPLRVPIGSLAERVIAARNAAPYDRPFVRA